MAIRGRNARNLKRYNKKIEPAKPIKTYKGMKKTLETKPTPEAKVKAMNSAKAAKDSATGNAKAIRRRTGVR